MLFPVSRPRSPGRPHTRRTHALPNALIDGTEVLIVLTQAQIAHYLVDEGLISPESIVNGDLEVAEVSRRNYNSKIVSDRGPFYLLKQLKDDSVGQTVANEALACRLLEGLSTGNALRRYIPRVVKYDSDHGIPSSSCCVMQEIFMNTVREATESR